jgi:hypothetical protein
MPLLPKPYPDEVAGSILSRACRHSGLPMRRLLGSIFGTGRSTCSFLLGQSILPLAYRAGIEPDEFLDHHTMFPYAIAFMAPAVQKQLKSKALAAKPREDCLGSLTKNISHGVAHRRLCMDCIEADLAQFGESYWHRQHLLPGALICLHHGVPLFETDIELRGRTQVADTVLPHEARDLSPASHTSLEHACSITSISVAALRSEMPPSDEWTDLYRAKAIALGFVLPWGDVAGSALAHMFRQHFGCEYLLSTGCQVPTGSKSAWPSLMVRSGCTTPHFATPKHVLMQSFLAAGVCPPKHISSMYGAPGKRARDYGRLDTSTLAKLRTQLEMARRTGERLSIKSMLKDAEAWSAYKHHPEFLPKTGAFLQEFKRSDLAERQIGGRPYWRKRLPSRYGRSAD